MKRYKFGSYEFLQSDSELLLKYYRTLKDYFDIYLRLLFITIIACFSLFVITQIASTSNQELTNYKKVIIIILIVIVVLFILFLNVVYVYGRIMNSTVNVFRYDKSEMIFYLRGKYFHNGIKESNINSISYILSSEVVNIGSNLKERSWVEIYFELCNGEDVLIDIVNPSRVIDKEGYKTINELMSVAGEMVKFIAKETGLKSKKVK